MKLRIIIAALLLLVLFSGIALSSAPTVEPAAEKTVKQDAKAAFTEMIEKDGMSGSIYALCEGQTIYDKGFGEASPGKKNNSDTVFAVASVTKEFTATAIMLLYEDDKLDLDDTLDDYFPDYKYGKDITLRMLLCQRSGIPDFSVDYDKDTVFAYCDGDDDLKDKVELDKENSSAENRELILETVFKRKLLFEPEDRFDYSDSNYMLLAEVVEQVTGESEHEFVRKRIFEPLGMTHAAFIDDNDFGDDVVIAQPDHVEFKDDYSAYKGVEYGCGDMMLSPKDLYKWYRAFCFGNVVSDESYKLMTTNYSDKDELGYGFGLMISEEGDSKVIYHYGWIPSFYSSVFYVPELDYFQTVLGNRSTGNPQTVSARLILYFGELKNTKFGNIF